MISDVLVLGHCLPSYCLPDSRLLKRQLLSRQLIFGSHRHTVRRSQGLSEVEVKDRKLALLAQASVFGHSMNIFHHRGITDV